MDMELSSDLVEEILSWVPGTSLARLKYTCKEWKTLIAEPRFVKKHLSHSHMRCLEQQFTVFNNVSNSQSSVSTVSFVGIDLREPSPDLQDFEPLPRWNLLVQKMYHCDGLLLFVTRTMLLVSNPLLKQSRWIKCGYGRDQSMDAYGLGYVSNHSSSCDDYRMVRFRCGASDKKGSRIEVYEFKSDCWKVVADKSFDNDRFLELPESSVCLRGTPYWIGYQNGKTFSMIQSFDFSKERFEPLFLPPSSVGSSKSENSLSLGIFRGDKLSLLHISRVTGRIHLWVMKKHWSRLMTVAVPELSLFPRYSSYYIDNDGRLVLSVRDVRSIHIYIVGKDDDECQNVEYPSLDPSIGGSGCYYAPSLLQIPGLFKAKRRSSGFF